MLQCVAESAKCQNVLCVVHDGRLVFLQLVAVSVAVRVAVRVAVSMRCMLQCVTGCHMHRT